MGSEIGYVLGYLYPLDNLEPPECCVIRFQLDDTYTTPIIIEKVPMTYPQLLEDKMYDVAMQRCNQIDQVITNWGTSVR